MSRHYFFFHCPCLNINHIKRGLSDILLYAVYAARGISTLYAHPLQFMRLLLLSCICALFVFVNDGSFLVTKATGVSGTVCVFCFLWSVRTCWVANVSQQLSADTRLMSRNPNSRSRWICERSFLLSVLKWIIKVYVHTLFSWSIWYWQPTAVGDPPTKVTKVVEVFYYCCLSAFD